MDVIAVDDDPTGLALLTMLLENAGHTVRTCRDAVAGLQLIREGPLPSVVVTDLQLGVGRDGGYRLISAIRADPACDRVGIVALTGITSVDDLQRARVAGADRCVAKPFDIDALLETLTELSESRAPAADARSNRGGRR